VIAGADASRTVSGTGRGMWEGRQDAEGHRDRGLQCSGRLRRSPVLRNEPVSMGQMGAAGVQEEAGGAVFDFEDLQALREELLRVARLPYKPDQNDGVLISAAPLWRLFRHKPWQKELAKCWDTLESGGYDWSHLALALRPEHVRALCRTDKSVAIAHGLEDLYGA